MPVHPLCRALLAAVVSICGCAHADSVERGRQLLAQYQCGSCHSIPGVPSAGGRVASSLEGFGLRSYIAGRLANRHDTLARWIEQPKALVPDTAMPSMGVSAADARAMAAYLLELK
jgi:cytochrome c